MKKVLIGLTLLISLPLFAVTKSEIGKKASEITKEQLETRYTSNLEKCISMALDIAVIDNITMDNLDEVSSRTQKRCHKQIDALTFIGADTVNILTNELMKYVQ